MFSSFLFLAVSSVPIAPLHSRHGPSLQRAFLSHAAHHHRSSPSVLGIPSYPLRLIDPDQGQFGGVNWTDSNANIPTLDARAVEHRTARTKKCPAIRDLSQRNMARPRTESVLPYLVPCATIPRPCHCQSTVQHPDTLTLS